MQVCKFDKDGYFMSELYVEDDYVLSLDETTVIPTYTADKECKWNGVSWDVVPQRVVTNITTKTFTKLDIIRKITPTEWKAFSESVDANVVYAFAAFNAATEIVSTDSLTIQLFCILESAGILTVGRKEEILS